MLSKACTYGIRALVYITQKTEEGKRVGSKEIAEHTKVPEPFIAKILQQIKKVGLIESAKGPKGGFYMLEDQLNVTLYKIVETIDGDDLMTSCGLGFEHCSDEKPCPLHNHFKGIKSDLNKMLIETTILDLAKGVEKGEAFLI
ncbi:Rrf2 family transcriptional regulator [Flammeovirga sp. MY04]|uniref:RrF2 family transcriptional regulator n=1 Tax=Flammeovirga sp. MY04 TaxID=1191459 RepID=UPI0008063621|nr:Rrf2 family transcriptional regulator [Flammeovirga sp. MY04]ANQ52629.1 Rrf2 family transcriptional regulator [Flammeovirga sp. MY04]